LLTGVDFVFIEADIRNFDALSEIFERYQFDAVIHFAGLKSVGDSLLTPIEYYDNNINGLLQLVSVMKNYNVKSLIFSSSATVYGAPLDLPLTEESPLSEPTNPYGRSKIVCENILEDLFRSDSSWDIVCLRYFNPVGADPSGLLGENPIGKPNNLMPFVSRVASGVYDKVLVFGGDYDTPDGTGIRDYIHVVDLSRGHTQALKYISKSVGFQIFNLGTGRGYSVLEVIAQFQLESGIIIPYEIVSRRNGDVPICYASTARAKRLLDWEAQLGLEQMCEDSWKWQSLNVNGYIS